MRYFVISSDGQKYGPADVATLNQWITEGRLLSTQMLEDEVGQRMPASSVTGLNFPLAEQPTQPQQTFAPGQPYQQHYARPDFGGDDGSADLRNAWIFAVTGLFCCIFLHIGGLICASKAAQKGNRGAKAVQIFIGVVLTLQIVWIIFIIYRFTQGGFPGAMNTGVSP